MRVSIEKRRFMTVAQIANEFECGLRTAYRIAALCKPVPTPGGRNIRVERIHFENWVRKQREEKQWQLGQVPDSFDEDASSTAGSQSPAAALGESPPTARTAKPRRPQHASSSDEPRTRPIKPRTRPQCKRPAIAS